MNPEVEMKLSGAEADSTPTTTNHNAPPVSTDKTSFSKHFSKNENESRITLVWENIHLYVLSKDPLKSKFLRPAYKNKHILNGVSGKATSGELLAIMGPTGRLSGSDIN